MSLFGPPNVEKMKARRYVKGLIKALGYPNDDKIRSGAARALGEIGDVSAVEPLITALKDGNWDVCLAAAEALLQIGDPFATEPVVDELILRLKDPPSSIERKTSEWDYRQQAARILLRLYETQLALHPRIVAVKVLSHVLIPIKSTTTRSIYFPPRGTMIRHTRIWELVLNFPFEGDWGNVAHLLGGLL